jgi:nucleoside-diphosphate-sugar epimerase
MTVGIVGASGFIGKELIRYFKSNPITFHYASMSRNYQLNQNWRMIDLFSKSITTEALQNIDVAIYLVHSMLPSSRLTQGHFFDIDLLLADNFIRACKANNVKKIIYISGIIPEFEPELSAHLKSRKEVEDLFLSSGIQTTVIRTGIVLGDKGSSFNILKKVVEVSPFILVPPELHNLIQVITVDLVVKTIVSQIHEPNPLPIINLGLTPISYFNLMKLMCLRLNKNPKFIDINFYPVKIFSFLTSILTKAPYNLVRPLFESLKHNMITKDINHTTDVKTEILKMPITTVVPNAFKPSLEISKVRSVQRINLKRDLHHPIYKVYYRWLRKNVPLVSVKELDNHTLIFYFGHTKLKLLELQYVESSSSEDRQMLFIKGGLLASKDQDYGRMEFRLVKDKTIICALHDYIPALPWWIYIFTQALIHRYVMYKFKRFLEDK